MVLRGQSDKNIRIRRADWRRIAVGKIDAAVGQAYIVDNALHLGCRYLLSNRLLDLIAKVGRLFNAHSRGSTHVKLESTAVHTGKEVPAQPGNKNDQGAEAKHEKGNQENTLVIETSFQQAAIAAVKFLEGCLKPFLEAYQRIAAGGVSGFLLFSPQQVLCHGRNDGPRKEIRGQHGEQ